MILDLALDGFVGLAQVARAHVDADQAFRELGFFGRVQLARTDQVFEGLGGRVVIAGGRSCTGTGAFDQVGFVGRLAANLVEVAQLGQGFLVFARLDQLRGFLQRFADFGTEDLRGVDRGQADHRSGGGESEGGRYEAEVCEAEFSHYRNSLIQNRHGRETLPCSL